ncbi:hypothetical protein N8580_03950 [Akkermansiaceae bacterium]|nr:hypothetical protein [Akkermansiaceae bacterium]MDB0056035.1 hypothetical protein [Akkermansiaceae bacterium]MDB4722979.1 hypothetical protein [Akkermansiaceae bacterium]
MEKGFVSPYPVTEEDQGLTKPFSPKIESFLPPVRRRLGEGGDRELEELFLSRRGQQIILPEKNLPSLEALTWHRSRIGGR